MNYKQKIKEWDDEKTWREFSVDFLNDMGWQTYEISGNIVICNYKGIRYLVSFRHNINKGAIGTYLEKNITDRIKEHNAEGFIGFYSENYTTSLLWRLTLMQVHFKLFNGSRITTFIPFTHSTIIDTYFGSGVKGHRFIPANYYLNLNDESFYKPLECLCGCGEDILDPLNITYSMVLIHREKNNIYLFYGIKSCINKIHDNTECGWLEISQILHPDQFIEWNQCVRNYIEKNRNLNTVDFYKLKRLFTMRIMQRMRSVNAGLF
ncbi:hypothetical protein KKJ25_19470 [Xenorhabdus bovienii]|uniref:hypothetical protein n=1 Tax=Xenorhabdus bovienii TaxID=40576 RepID=UPI00237CDDB5|nr:hypothetical protein [Xenorhabdus bovienii]MDE1497048.1 hypothetical protein [Xenorhabdus bovienii]MDE9475006.1 hypothetical protein [Xenorhabdus bovienii]